MSKTIEFYFDVGSPTAFLADGQLKKLAEKYGAELVYEPILLGAVHKATNNVPPGLVPAKGRYMMLHDMPRFIARYGVPFKMNPHFPVNTLMAMRGCFAAKALDCFEAYVDTVFQAMWVKGLNMSDPDVFVSALNEAGLDGAKIAELVASDEIKDQLKANTSKAVEKGCFGAPTMYIGDQMFFGQDRLDFVEEALQ